jgi:hypothetical protein
MSTCHFTNNFQKHRDGLARTELSTKMTKTIFIAVLLNVIPATMCQLITVQKTANNSFKVSDLFSNLLTLKELGKDKQLRVLLQKYLLLAFIL